MKTTGKVLKEFLSYINENWSYMAQWLIFCTLKAPSYTTDSVYREREIKIDVYRRIPSYFSVIQRFERALSKPSKEKNPSWKLAIWLPVEGHL